jgi:hypothetical protein
MFRVVILQLSTVGKAQLWEKTERKDWKKWKLRQKELVLHERPRLKYLAVRTHARRAIDGIQFLQCQILTDPSCLNLCLCRSWNKNTVNTCRGNLMRYLTDCEGTNAASRKILGTNASGGVGKSWVNKEAFRWEKSRTLPKICTMVIYLDIYNYALCFSTHR